MDRNYFISSPKHSISIFKKGDNLKKSIVIFVVFLFIFSLIGCSNVNVSSDSNTVDTKQSQDENKEKLEANDKILNKKISENEINTNEESVVYKGPIEHIFFHPLVIYPERAFDGDRMSKGYNDWFVTVKEFNRILDSLYKKNYILIKTSDLFEEKTVNGKVTLVKKDLKLPKDKKPLILSVDDLNYYPYMIENGNANKLVIDKKGNLATYSKNLQGKDIISEENEIVPILNRFVNKHSDFSLNNAKGILALTGYEGVLGYRTNDLTSKNYNKEKKEAIKVVKKLKEDGWELASHGYGHLNAANVSLDKLVQDTKKWKKEVEPLIGKTNIYIYPYGSSVLPNDPKFQALQALGFKVFDSVGPNAYLSYTNEYAMMDRVHIDGMALETQHNMVSRFFDSTQIIDQDRYAFFK